MSASTIEILIGGSWQYDIRSVAQIQSFGGSGVTFDYSPILDTIDIVVNGTNITAKLPEENIFCVMHDLVSGLSTLWEGRQDKHILSFEEGPFELALQRGPGGFELSFYGTGTSREVVTHNLLVDPTTFRKVAEQAAVQLIDDLLRINGAFSQEMLVKSLRRKLHRLRARAQKLPGPMADLVLPPQAGKVSLVSGDHKLALEITFDGTHPDFWRYQGALPSDLHSLLFRGSLILRYWGRRRILAPSSYLFGVIEGLVSGAERLVSTIHYRTGGCVLLDPGAGIAGLLTAEVAEEDHVWLRVTEPGGGVGQTRTTQDTLVSLLLDASTMVLTAIGQLNPRQLLNDRVGDLIARVRRTRRHFNTILQGNIYYSQTEDYLQLAPKVEPVPPVIPPPAEMPHPFAKMRHLFLRSAWYLARNRIDLRGLTLHGPWLLVPSAWLLECVDREQGRVHWRSPCDRLLATSPDLALVLRDNSLVALDMEQGKPLWASLVTAHPGEALVYIRDGCPTALITVAEVGLISLELEHGRTEWALQLEHGEITSMVWAGPVLVLGADDGYVYGLKPDTGELLWRHHVEGAGALPPFHCGGFLYHCADTASGSESILVGLSPLTGRKVGEHLIPASIARPPLVVGSVAVFLLEPIGSQVVLAIDLKTWRVLWSLSLENAGIDSALVSWISLGTDGIVLVKTEQGVCYAISRRNGQLAWSIPLLEKGDILLHNLAPQLVQDHLVIPERFVSIIHPRTGQRLHRLISLPEHASYLHVDEGLRMIIAESDDHLECFDLKGFLALI